jgi:hypothetical protein
MDHPDSPHPGRDRFVEAAIEAELNTGVRESTVEQAKAHLLIRLVRITAGSLITLVGAILGPIPGFPGIVVILLGLSILAVDVPFARRLRDGLISKADKATSFIPRKAKIALVAAGTAVSIAVPVLLFVR